MADKSEKRLLDYKDCKEILASEFVVWGADEEEYAIFTIPLLRSQDAKSISTYKKELYRWGSEICTEHYDKMLKRGGQPRRCCYQCWQRLVKGEEGRWKY